MTTRSLNCFISSRFSLDSRLMSLMSSAMFSSFTTTIVSFSARLSVSSCVSFLSFLCFEQIPKKIANATDTPEISEETSIVNGVLLSPLCRLDVVGVAVEKEISNGEIQPQSYDRYCTDFERFFPEKLSICKKCMQNITEEDLTEYIKTTIHEKHLTRKAYSGLSTLISFFSNILRGISKSPRKCDMLISV